MFSRVLAIAFALLAAGCLGGAPAEDDTTPAGATDDAPQDAVAVAATAETAEMTVVEPVVTPISYSGTTPAGACAAVLCEWPVAGTEDFHMIDIAGAAQWLSVSIAYAQQQPGMEFYAAVCPEGGEGGAECSEYITAASPLALEVDLAQFAAGTRLGISVGSLNGAAGATGTLVFAAVDFDVTGTATSLPNA